MRRRIPFQSTTASYHEAVHIAGDVHDRNLHDTAELARHSIVPQSGGCVNNAA